MTRNHSNHESPAAGTSSEMVRYWPLLLGCFLGVMCGVSALYYYTQGIFIKPIAAEFGWSRAVLSSGALITVAATALLAPVSGALIDRFGARGYVTLSMVGLAFSVWWLSRLTGSITQYYVSMVLLALCSSGTTPLSFSRAVNEWFASSRGLALGIAGAGGGVAAAIAPWWFSRIVADDGWRQGYRVMALFMVIMTPILWWLLRAPVAASAHEQNHPQVRTGMTAATALRTARFWMLAAMLMFASLGASAVIVHFVPMLTDAGMSPPQAAAYASVIGVSVVVSRVLAGALMDWMFAPLIALVVFACATFGALLLAHGGAELAWLGALLMGAALGTESDLTGYLVVRYFGMRNFGVIYGYLYGAFLIGIACGPLLAGTIFDQAHSYQPALHVAAAVFALAALLSIGLGKFPVFASPPDK